MKASELTESGFYWYKPAPESPVPHVYRLMVAEHGAAMVWVDISHPSDPSSTRGWKVVAEFRLIRGRPQPTFDAIECGGEFLGPLRPPAPSREGCRARLAPGQHWAFCGETDMGQSLPALCTQCGGDFRRAE